MSFINPSVTFLQNVNIGLKIKDGIHIPSRQISTRYRAVKTGLCLNNQNYHEHKMISNDLRLYR